MSQVELLQEAQLLCAKGSFASAAELYSKALEAKVQLHGELSPETAEYYYHYGYSLLQSYLSSVDSNLFGEKVIEAATEVLASSQSSAESDPGSTVNEAGSAVSEEEDLQLAWEALESARIIHSRTFNYAALMDTHSALGELENARENYGSAVEEYKQALDCADAQSPPRRIAELEYRLGLTYLAIFGTEAEAIAHFTRAVEILEQVYAQQPDEELQSVLKEVQEKLEDAKEQQTSLPAVQAESQSLSQCFDQSKFSQTEAVDLGVFGKRKSQNAASTPAKQTKPESNASQ